MKARSFLLIAALGMAPVMANDALDILEGHKEVEDIDLPPLPEEQAADPDKPPVFVEPQWAPGPMDSIWSRAILFEDPTDPWVQQVAVMGLFDWRASWGEAEVEGGGNTDLDTTRTRRARLGARMKIFGNTEIEAVGEFAGEGDFRRLERFKAITGIRDGYQVEYGKFRPTFGIESSKNPEELLTPHRSLLVNMMMPAESLGVSIQSTEGPWRWHLGYFSADQDPYFPSLQSDGFLVAGVAHTFTDRDSAGNPLRTTWHADYIHNFDMLTSETVPRYRLQGRRAANGGGAIPGNPAFRHLVSTGIKVEAERYAYEGEFLFAQGRTDAWGLSFSPSYWIVPGMLQAVGRYHFADTNDPGGLVGGLGAGADPFFDASPTFVGDEFHSFYLGANLHLYRDKVLLMNGIEYALMNDGSTGFDTEALMWHSGARLSF
jgi:hypothetical protein